MKAGQAELVEKFDARLLSKKLGSAEDVVVFVDRDADVVVVWSVVVWPVVVVARSVVWPALVLPAVIVVGSGVAVVASVVAWAAAVVAVVVTAVPVSARFRYSLAMSCARNIHRPFSRMGMRSSRINVSTAARSVVDDSRGMASVVAPNMGFGSAATEGRNEEQSERRREVHRQDGDCIRGL